METDEWYDGCLFKLEILHMIEALFSLMKCASWILHLSDCVTQSTKESIMWLDWDHSHLKSLWYNFQFLISSIYFRVHCPFYCKYPFGPWPSTFLFETRHGLTAKGGLSSSILFWGEIFKTGLPCAEFFIWNSSALSENVLPRIPYFYNLSYLWERWKPDLQLK